MSIDNHAGSSSPPGAGRAGRPRDPAVQRQILEAAYEIVREGGYAALSMEGVAGRAGVSKQSVYRRWSSRGDLLVDLYMGTAEQQDAPPEGQTFKARFESYLQWSVHRLFDPSRANMLRALATEGQADPAVRQALLSRIVEPRLALGRDIILRGQQTGEVRADLDVDIALDFLFGSVWFSLLVTGRPLNEAWQERSLSAFFLLTT
ncbi:TetR/AcrR family transcriptional regulator [Bosea psychrotolerans]|uniref:TetR family transcriptional regulator n=1 Tax=Bosea psychrotolerans TaxID=1871628 RepID=A0A2S4MAZ0_9HYPH|nr:TetR/AcrR family transcriptional regulator [Bosea psychrotolerans]POR51908.1 TetR family transcriptional regulator [Bosea psychrotolerans]